MLNDQEIDALATALESERVERKSSISDKERISEAICAFSNDLPGSGLPGTILIGVDDSGQPTGLTVTDQLLLELGAIRSDGNILPLPAMQIEKRKLRGHDIVCIEVTPSPDTPVRYRGRVYIRVGARKAIASRHEEQILAEKRRSADLTYDRQGSRFATIDDLDLEFFRSHYLPAAVASEILRENGRSEMDQLRALHLLAPGDEINHGALLLFGKDVRRWLPGAYVQFVRFQGPDLTSPIQDQKELSGSISDVLRRIDELIAVHIQFNTKVEGRMIEERIPDYPASALQQLLRNAILHRSYEVNSPVYWYWFSDRIEIHSPGSLYGRVTPELFGKPGVTDYRNPLLAEGLKTLNFVQRFGMGVQIAKERCRENGNPEPGFEFSQAAVLATIYRRP